MRLLILLSLLLIQNSFAATGTYVLRDKQELKLVPKMELKLNDVVVSQNSDSVVNYAGTQLILAKGTEIKIIEPKLVDITKGLVRVKVSKVRKVRVGDVTFSAKSAEFELLIEENKDIDLDVIKGEVVVSSPHVHTFVPEVVKAKEGFKYEYANKSYGRRKFVERFKNGSQSKSP
jgi:hypothetical protein